jgi:ParB family transcriptional regulator, chromosome partitioning protein
MITHVIKWISISEIRIINPRPRNKLKFDQVVASINALGLKTPIVVSERELVEDGTRYDLMTGEGRIESFLKLGWPHIPACVVTLPREDLFLMSLVENIARRPPSNLALLEETKRLRIAGYTTNQIADKLGFGARYIASIVALIDKGEVSLLKLVEAGRIPISVALEISQGTSSAVQKALTEAYESGELRGAKLKAVRNLIRKRAATPSGAIPKAPVNLRGNELAKQYQEYTREQRELVKRAAAVNERLMILSAASRKLFADEKFVTLLQAEALPAVSERLRQLSMEG